MEFIKCDIFVFFDQKCKYFLQYFSFGWVQQQMAEHSSYQQNNIHKSFMQMVFEKNTSSASTKIKMTMDPDSFPSLILVGHFYKMVAWKEGGLWGK